MCSHRLLFLTGSLLLLLTSYSATAQTTPKTGAFTDTPTDNGGSHVLRFAATGAAENKQAVVLNVLVREEDTKEPVMGSTVLLRREKPVRMYGKVTGQYGTCSLNIAPDTYAVRVQVTGLASFEQSGFMLEPGTVYTLEIALAFTKK